MTKRAVHLIFLLLVSLAGTPDGNAQFFAGQQQALVTPGFNPADWGTPTLSIIPQQDPLLSPGNAAEDVTDLSPNGYDFTQATAASRPLWESGAAPSGIAALTFDGVDDFMSAGDVLDLRTNSRTIAILYKNQGTGGTPIAKALAGVASSRWAVVRQSGITYGLYYWVSELGTNFSDSETDWHLLVVVFDRAVGTQIFVNDTLVASSSNSNANDFDSVFPLLMGAYNDASGGASPPVLHLTGEISALCVWDEVLADRPGMSAALMAYGGITP